VQYMLLIYNDENEWATLSDDERGEITRRYMAVADELRAQGSYVAGAPLTPSSTASTVRVRNGEELVIDGPFAETKEQLGGYFLIEAVTEEEAQYWAARMPAAEYGAIEVRPVIQVGAPA